MAQVDYVLWLDAVNNQDLDRVGGKNASLGELIGNLKPKGIRVPDGFAITAAAYREILRVNQLEPQIQQELEKFTQERQSLAKTGKAIRRMIQKATFPPGLEEAIRKAYRELSRRYQVDEADVAVRSSATAEDLPDASFAGQQETFLNVSGEDEILEACRHCYASLFTNRAISYRV